MIRERLLEDLKIAMRNNDIIKKNTIQLIRASILNAEKDAGEVLTETQVEEILLKERKKREDALAQFQVAARTDLIEQTQREIVCIETYLPKQLSEFEVEEIVEAVINELDAKPQNIGAVIRKVKEKCGNRATGTLISRIVKSKLNI